MNDIKVLEIIKESLLNIIAHKDAFDIIFLEIDTSISDIKKGKIVPFLNLYAYTKFNKNDSLDQVIKTALDNHDLGFMIDILDLKTSSSFEISLEILYPNWPEKLDEGDAKVIGVIKENITNNKEKFEPIRKLYFSYLDSFEFVRIIDKPA
jgi:hypothetical protein